MCSINLEPCEEWHETRMIASAPLKCDACDEDSIEALREAPIEIKRSLLRLLDRVDARDSLAFGEALDEEALAKRGGGDA